MRTVTRLIIGGPANGLLQCVPYDYKNLLVEQTDASGQHQTIRYETRDFLIQGSRYVNDGIYPVLLHGQNPDINTVIGLILKSGLQPGPVPERIKAPWPDFKGGEIHEGDTIEHPCGQRGRVVFFGARKRPQRPVARRLRHTRLVLVSLVPANWRQRARAGCGLNFP